MSEEFSRLIRTIAQLRGEQGCPWDREQTRESVKHLLLEEVYEVLEAMEEGSSSQLREELGDLLLQIVFHSQIAQEKDEFDAADVVNGCIDKLVRRHPHVFGDGKVADTDAVLQQWEDIKRGERASKSNDSRGKGLLSSLPKALPALLLSYQVQERTSRIGFDWPAMTPQTEGLNSHGVWDKMEEETRELQEAIRLGDRQQIEHEMGDLLFTCVNLARHLKVEPEGVLRQATRRFISRFELMEDLALESETPLHELGSSEMEVLWEKAKGLL